MRRFFTLLSDVALLAGLGVCAWWWPMTVGVAEAVCAVGTVALFSVERRVGGKTGNHDEHG